MIMYVDNIHYYEIGNLSKIWYQRMDITLKQMNVSTAKSMPRKAFKDDEGDTEAVGILLLGGN